jgi:TPR repeat protein
MTWDGRRVRRNAPMALAVVVLLAVSLNCASRTGERRYTREALDRDCRGGDGEACEILASSFLEGKGVEKDVNLAYGYLYDACALDRAHACYRVGAHLRHHAKKNPELRPRARELLEKACALDDATACDHIGADLYNGNGVFTADEKDVAAARGHFERQCGRRYLQSCVNLATSFRENGSLTRAFVASERACALGSTDQCALVGRLKVRGEGTPRDVAAGLRMLGERCFDRDEAMACENWDCSTPLRIRVF